SAASPDPSNGSSVRGEIPAPPPTGWLEMRKAAAAALRAVLRSRLETGSIGGSVPVPRGGGSGPDAASYDPPAPMAGVSAQFSVTVRVELDSRNEPLGKITGAIAEAGGALQSVDLVPGAGGEGKRVREFTIDARDPEHWQQILRAIGSTRGARVLDYTDRTFAMHR